MDLKRDLLEQLIAWEAKRKRKPLILQGAREWLVDEMVNLSAIIFSHYTYFGRKSVT